MLIESEINDIGCFRLTKHIEQRRIAHLEACQSNIGSRLENIERNQRALLGLFTARTGSTIRDVIPQEEQQQSQPGEDNAPKLKSHLGENGNAAVAPAEPTEANID